MHVARHRCRCQLVGLLELMAEQVVPAVGGVLGTCRASLRRLLMLFGKGNLRSGNRADPEGLQLQPRHGHRSCTQVPHIDHRRGQQGAMASRWRSGQMRR